MWETADAAGLVALMKNGVVLAMPPAAEWYTGRAAVEAFVAHTVFAEHSLFGGLPAGRWRVQPTAANAEPAFGLYHRQPDGSYQPLGLSVLSLEGGQIISTTSFLDPRLLDKFGLPTSLPAGVDSASLPPPERVLTFRTTARTGVLLYNLAVSMPALSAGLPQRLLVAYLPLVGAPLKGIEMHPRWPHLPWLSLGAALVLVFSGFGPAWPVLAAPLSPWRFNVIPPRAPICENNEYPFLVTVVSGVGKVGGFISHPGARVEASVLDTAVGFVTPASQSGVFFQDTSDMVEDAPGQMSFTFHSKKAGTTTLKLTTTNNQGQVIKSEVPVTVEHCEEEITAISTWDIPGPAHLGLIASIHRAPMDADEQGHLTGTANVKWFLVTGRVEDCAGEITLVNETQADLTGQMGPGDQVTVNVFYQPAEINLANTCANAEGTISGDRHVLVTPQTLRLAFPAAGGTVTLAHILDGPEQTPGSAVIVVHPVTP